MAPTESITLVGYLAGFLTTLAFVPQVLHIWRTRSTRDISLYTFSTFTVGIFLWLVYGILKSEWPIVIANGVTFVLAGAILGMKLRFRD
jgi:MtN3 and saliva related transmembrane protein